MLQFLVGILKIRNVIGSMEWNLHCLNCLIQRRRLSIATTPPLVTTTQTWSWFSRYLCLCRSSEILTTALSFPFDHNYLSTPQGEKSRGLFGNRCWLWVSTYRVSDQDWGAVGFWVEQIWPAWGGGHQGKGCCH